ncbi:sialate O-acetylesterase [Algoriphagus sp. AK58]|uniref:sialate O-acetylesterase n=1 Tax=Algoriphagus sp. AK58 TaxID=1406877 RepID=UPI001650D15A|nr:sialate O-acetylesterase [Algoriphagus sp. AK58]MBC6366012.1 sialate O-acetylesterase [Algoriphagus sp. AK58]
MRKYALILGLVAILFGCEVPIPQSPVILPKLISKGMVLQRDQPVQIWGKGSPGEKVRVALAGAVGSAKVAEDSTWKVQLPPLAAGGPFQLQVNVQTVEDVYIGDVWLAGGQSNMEWALNAGVIGREEEFANPDYPQIRFFKVEKDYSAAEKSDVSSGSWKVANAENLPDFSAVAWFFAKKNHLEQNVPVGIIESNWGGTPAEGWTEAQVLAKIEDRSYTEEAREVIENQAKWKEILTENEKRREMRDLLVRRPDSLMAGEVASLAYTESGWKNISLPAANPLEHIAWVRKKFNLSSKAPVILTLSRVEQMGFIYLNGVQIHYKDWGAAMPDLELPADLLKMGQNVLTIRAINTWDNHPAIGTAGGMYLTQNGKKISLEGNWSYSNDVVEPQLPKVEYFNWKPGFMFNAMIAPLTSYAIRGVIWYQGESNAGRAEEYRELFGTMITNWRTRWNQEEMPFLFVQLANFMERKEVQPESNWAFLREAQTQTLELPNTGMATIIDIGEEGDIHPRNKKDVGERLWLQARKVVFGEEILASGPQIREVKREGNHVLVSFDEVGEGLKLAFGDEVLGFIMEDAEGQFEVVKGAISGSDLVTLTIPEGLTPVGIRYAWADNPEVNLVNSIHLPTTPFRKSF